MKTIITLISLTLLCAAVWAQETPPAAPAATMSAEAQACLQVVERAPQGAASQFGADVGAIYCWSRISGGSADSKVFHVWSYKGTEVARVELAVRSGSWRTWSKKTIMPSQTGEWSVAVQDEAGNQLTSVTFTVGP